MAEPNFIIIGVQKGGTSSMFYYLSQHPQIKTPPEKEIHFFDLNYSKGIEWYLNKFKDQDKTKITGEASPYYIFHPLVPERMAKYFPHIKIIVLLRNPIDRAYAHYKMQVRNKFENCGSFENAIELEKTRLKGEFEKIINLPNYNSFSYQKHSYLTRGDYAIQIKRWFKFFDKSQFLFIKSEDFFNNTRFVLNRVYTFLDVKEEYPSKLDIKDKGTYSNMLEATKYKLQLYYKSKLIELHKLIGSDYDWF